MIVNTSYALIHEHEDVAKGDLTCYLQFPFFCTVFKKAV